MGGNITREFTVWCTDCNEFHQVCEPNLKNAIVQFERIRWKKLKKSGWMCPGCFDKLIGE